MSRWPRWVGRALRSCVVEHDMTTPPTGLVAALESHDPRPLAAAAAQHRVRACLYRSVKRIDVAEPLLPALAASYAANQRHQLRLLAELPGVAEILAGADVAWLVLKGPYLSEIAYRHRDLREYADLDLLVRRQDFSVAVRAFCAAGFTVARRDWRLAAQQRAGEIDLVSPHGTPVDLHWQLLYHDDARRPFRLMPDAMVRRARVQRIATGSVPVPEPADALVHLAVHAAAEGGVRLQWLCDLDQVVRHDPPDDWQYVVSRAALTGTSLVVGTMLLRAARVLGTPVPSQVLARLLPRPWRFVVGTVDAVSPPERSSGQRSLGSLVTRSTSADLAATFGRLPEAAAAAARATLRADPASGRVTPQDTVPADDDPRNDPRELDRYLDAVARPQG